MTTGTPGLAHCDVSNWTASHLMPIIYSLVFCLGLPGNILALVVLCRRGGRLKAAMRVYLLNLTMADVLFTLTLPVWVSYYSLQEDWLFQEAACRVIGALYYITTYCTISFLTIISINRYRSLNLTPPCLPMLQKRGAAIICALTWLTWLVCAAPSLAVPQTRREAGRVQCFRDVDPRLALAACCLFAVSFLAVLASYLSVLGSLGQHPTGQGAHRRRAKARVLGMLLLFLGCVLPYHVTLAMWALQEPRPLCPSLAHRLSTSLLSATSCLDPFIYCFSLKCFRAEVYKLLIARSSGQEAHSVWWAGFGKEPRSSTRTLSS
ncbi:platelet-activating factor receptor-like [Megalops cyprinoides]|uniref:platelet-activating factor receptor-like n=1 Tax=Megalops cyprinoides TaxID=118141 RepID=UPI0018646426|nr:platelet-activating factor receptor-like [Megalops cyprinoides]